MLSFLSFRDANILTPPLLSLEYLTFYLYKLILRRKKGRLLSQTPFFGYRLWVLEYQLCEIVEAVLFRVRTAAHLTSHFEHANLAFMTP